MAIKFANRTYFLNHNRKPRGVGLWAFEIRANDQTLTDKKYPYNHFQSGNFVTMFTSDVMTLTEAKKEISKWLQENGFHGVVNVAPEEVQHDYH